MLKLIIWLVIDLHAVIMWHMIIYVFTYFDAVHKVRLETA